MNLRHQSSAMCIIMLGGEDTHPWSATKVRNPIPATIPITKKKQPTNYSSQKRVGGNRSKERDRKSELVLRSTFQIFECDRNNSDGKFL